MKPTRLKFLISLLILVIISMTGCGITSRINDDDRDAIKPTVSSTTPVDLSVGVAVNSSIYAIFSESICSASITTSNFKLEQGDILVPCTVAYDGTTVTLTPVDPLDANSIYIVTITPGVRDLAGNNLSTTIWGFTTGEISDITPPNLLSTIDFVILAQSGISTTGTTAIAGDIGISPAAATYITGFGLAVDSGLEYSMSSLVTGRIYSPDYAVPTPLKMTTAQGDMVSAYNEAQGDRGTPTSTELGAGDISGMTITPGLYKWSSDLLINADIYLNGGENEIWIFQCSQKITLATGTRVHLTGGARAENVYWAAFGDVTLNTTSHIEGTVMSQTSICLKTGASVTGRLQAQTEVTLDANSVVQP